MRTGRRDMGARRRFLDGLGRGLSVSAACREAGCARSTVYKWAHKGDQTVADALSRARRGLGEAPVEPPPPATASPGEDRMRLLGLAVLSKIAADEDMRPEIRVSAAKALAGLCRIATVKPEPAAKAAEIEQPRPQMSAAEATKRFRVVS